MPLPLTRADASAVDCVHRLARSHGFMLVCSDDAVGTERNKGGFMLVDMSLGSVIDGFRFDLDVESARAVILAIAAVGRAQARAEAEAVSLEDAYGWPVPSSPSTLS